MKKEKKIILSLISCIILLAIITFFSIQISAADTPQPSYPLGLNPDKIQNLPQTPEEAANATSSWLKKGWADFLSKFPAITSIHNFLKAHPMIFIILFNEKYDITWIFFVIVLLWLYIMAVSADFIGSFFNNKSLSILAGIGIAILLAQIGALKSISSFIVNFVFLESTWWLRIIKIILFIAIFALIYTGLSLGGNLEKAKKKQEKEESLEQEAKESKAFREGAKEAQEITKPLREMKKKFPLS